jgi:hypothetical protein
VTHDDMVGSYTQCIVYRLCVQKYYCKNTRLYYVTNLLIILAIVIINLLTYLFHL